MEAFETAHYKEVEVQKRIDVESLRAGFQV
jgi:hypothetical protein